MVPQKPSTVDIQKQLYDLTIRTFIEPWRFHSLLLHSLCNIKGFKREERPEIAAEPDEFRLANVQVGS